MLHIGPGSVDFIRTRELHRAKDVEAIRKRLDALPTLYCTDEYSWIYPVYEVDDTRPVASFEKFLKAGYKPFAPDTLRWFYELDPETGNYMLLSLKMLQEDGLWTVDPIHIYHDYQWHKKRYPSFELVSHYCYATEEEAKEAYANFVEQSNAIFESIRSTPLTDVRRSNLLGVGKFL